MAIGFKVADGYVEVHAHYDKGELRKAAENAADDNDKAYNKERERNSKSGPTRDSNRRIGAQANKDFVRGVREQVSRQKESPFIHVSDVRRDASRLGRVHVREFARSVEEGVVKEDTRLLRIGKQIGTHIRTGFAREFNKGIGSTFNKGLPKYRALGRKITGAMFGKDNAGKAGANFFKAFVEAITFGQADFSKPEIAGKLTKWGARLGTIGGVALATSLVFEVGNAITALLPIALGGALLALPIADLIARNVQLEKGKLSFKKNDVGKALKDLIRTGQKLADTLGKAFGGTFITGLKHATMLMKALVGPMERAVKAISPGALAMWNGLLQSIMTFGMAFQPALKGINAGLKEWGIQLPIIGRKLGEMFAQILKNPELVRNAVKGLSGILQGLIGLVGKLVYFLTVVSSAYDVFKGLRDAGISLVGSLGRLSPVIQRLSAAWAPLKRAILDAWNAFVKFASSQNNHQAIERMKTLLERIKAIWKPLKHFLGEIWKIAWDKVKEIWNTKVKPWVDGTLKPWLEKHLRAAARAGFKALEDEAKKWLKSLPGKAKDSLKSLPGKIGNEIEKAKDKAVQKIKDLVNRAVDWLKKLPGRAKSALSSLAGKVGTEISQAATKAKQKAKDLVDGFMKIIKGLPGKAKSALGKVKSAVTGAFSSAGSWLRGAGQKIIDGLVSGINAAKGAVKSALGAITSMIPSWKGPPSKDRKLLFKVGGTIIDGLIAGFKHAEPKVAKWLKKFSDRIADKKIHKATLGRLKDIAKAFDKTLDGKNSKLDKIRSKLQAQKDLLTQLRDAAKEYAKSIKDAAVGDITQNISPGNIVGGLQARLANQTAFLTNLEALKKLGLDQGALQQILDAGADTGNAFANALLSDPAQIAVVNDLQAKLRIIGGKLGQFGSTTFHKAGIDAAKGLVKGLESQEKQLIRAIEKLAHKLVAAFKKKLGIHSPSTVFAEEVGKPSAQGIVMGIEKNLPKDIPGLQNLRKQRLPEYGTDGGRRYHSSSTWSPSIHVHIQAGLETVNSAAKRALTKEIFLALEQYRKDYVDR